MTELPICAQYVAMYHSETSDSKKLNIISQLTEECSKLRVIIATSALGLGIDVKNCHSVVLYGVPDSLVDLLLEIGRVGRDDSSSVALILYNSYHLRKLSPEVKKVLKTTACRRKIKEIH